MSENKDLSAYPLQYEEEYGDYGKTFKRKQEGLTKRELIAAMAMQGILADGGHEFRDTHKVRIAELAIAHADELLNQLQS